MRQNNVIKRFWQRFVKNERAIAPVLSSLLLTVIAVSAMAIATSATYVVTSNMKENMSERVITEDVWFKSTTHTIEVYLTNIGKINIHVSNVYVNHTSQVYDSPFNLQTSDSGWLSIVYDWNSGNLYYIDIVTNRGTHIAGTYRAP
jgi:hypothetical protein